MRFAIALLSALAATVAGAQAAPTRLVVGWEAPPVWSREGAPATGFAASTLWLPPGVPRDAALRHIASWPGVRYVEVDQPVHALELGDDPLLQQQWALGRIHAPGAWLAGTGLVPATIAIVDTGIDRAQPDLAGSLVGGIDLVHQDGDPQDDNGHGTHCAGIAAAAAGNGFGMAGVAPGAPLMPVKVLDAQGEGYSSTVAQGIAWAVDHGASVIALSLGLGARSEVLADALRYAEARGAVVVAAAGNEGLSSPTYPAAYETVLAVGATDSLDRRCWFSNHGAWVALAAPGDEIWSTLPGGAFGPMSGTSMAAPHAAGVAAWVRTALGTSVPAWRVRERLLAASDPIGPWVAFGRLNAHRALVEEPGPAISLRLEPAHIPSGGWTKATIRLSRPAQGGGLWIELDSGERWARVPRRLWLPAGASTVTTRIMTFAVGSASHAVLGAEAMGVRAEATLDVVPLSIASLRTGPWTGSSCVATVALTAPAPAAGARIGLSAVPAGALRFANAVLVSRGKTEVRFRVTRVRGSAAQDVTLTATLGTSRRSETLSIPAP